MHPKDIMINKYSERGKEGERADQILQKERRITTKRRLKKVEAVGKK